MGGCWSNNKHQKLDQAPLVAEPSTPPQRQEASPTSYQNTDAPVKPAFVSSPYTGPSEEKPSVPPRARAESDPKPIPQAVSSPPPVPTRQPEPLISLDPEPLPPQPVVNHVVSPTIAPVATIPAPIVNHEEVPPLTVTSPPIVSTNDEDGAESDRPVQRRDGAIPSISDDDLQKMTKKDLVKMLQEYAPEEFLVSNKLRGSITTIAKKKRLSELVDAYHELGQTGQ